MSHLIQTIYFGSPFFVTKCLNRGNSGAFTEGIMAYANWRTEMLVDAASHPGIILTEEEDRIDYYAEPNTAIYIGVSCLKGFSISFESVGGSASALYTDATLNVIQGGSVVFTETVRIYAYSELGSTFETITTDITCVACGTFLEISFSDAPFDGGTGLECLFNGISEFY
jgi:hypothetical protein